jgi:hypothetical protein
VNDDMGSNRRRKRSSGRVEYNTPAVVLDCVERLDDIALDPCGNPRALTCERARNVFDERIDGLTQSWLSATERGGLVYVNPPYGSALKRWVPKMIAEAKAGCEIITLLPNSTESRWFCTLFDACDAALCWRGRLTFSGSPAPAFFGNALFYFGRRPHAFAAAFAEHAYPIKLAPKEQAA